MKKIFIAQLVFLLGGVGKILAQDAVFSQFTTAAVHLNPAFTGLSPSTKISFIYRYSLPLWPNAFVTSGVSVEKAFRDYNSGIGWTITKDESGDGIFSDTRSRLSYSYEVMINTDSRFRLGIDVGLINHRINWSRLIFEDQIDPLNGPSGSASIEDLPQWNNKTALDVGAGLLFAHPLWYAGLSIRHLNRPELTFLHQNLGTRSNIAAGWPARITFNVGTEIPFTLYNIGSRPAFISPNLMMIRQGPFQQVTGGAYIGMSSVFGGVWYKTAVRNTDALVGMVGYKHGIFKFAYSFDWLVSDLSNSRNGGSHEFSVILNFSESSSFKNRSSALDINNCLKLYSF